MSENIEQPPSVGRMVHYVSHGSPLRADGTQVYTEDKNVPRRKTLIQLARESRDDDRVLADFNSSI